MKVSSNVFVDEIDIYLEGRYICPYEAVWRTFGFPIQHRHLAVQLLDVHLERMQNVRFKDNQCLIEITGNDDENQTILTEWFANNMKTRAP